MTDKTTDIQENALTRGGVLNVVVMAKAPRVGSVKTRLTKVLSAHQAAAVHGAMMQCVLCRLPSHLHGKLVLALDGDMPEAPTAPPGHPAPPPHHLHVPIPPCWRIVSQGPGDLGQRMARVWRGLDQGPTAFLGVDSPDLPAAILAMIPAALERCHAALGPVHDGGYWVLGARDMTPALLHGIDWGSAHVYHQTSAAARHAGITLAVLPPWHDIDYPEDLAALQERLAGTDEPTLVRLREQLAAVLGASKGSEPPRSPRTPRI